MIKQHVFRLEISIDNTIVMQAAEAFNKLGCIEAGPSLAELLVLSQVVKQLAPVQEVHHKIELGWRLESVVQFHNEWTVDFLQDISLSYIHYKQARIGKFPNHLS